MMQGRGRPPGGGGRGIDKVLMGLLIGQPDGVPFTWLVKAGARRGVGKQTVWRHLNRLVATNLATYHRMRRLYYPSEGVLGVHGYGGPFKVDVKSSSTGNLTQAGVNPLMNGDDLFTLLTQRFQVLFQAYLNLLGMVAEMKTASASEVDAFSNLLLDYENGDLQRLAHEVWSQKKPLPLKALHGKEAQFQIRYTDPHKHPKTT